MSNSVMYIFLAAVFIVILIVTAIMIKNIFSKNNKTSKSIKKQIEELRKKISLNPKDLTSMYQLAMLEEKIQLLPNALAKYELLLKSRYFKNNNIDEIEIYKKLEEGYYKLNDKESNFKYAVKISKADPNNIYYTMKLGIILGKEGKYKLACEYFNKLIVTKENIDDECLKVAALSFFMIKDYKKSIVFLEEIYKKNYNTEETYSLEKLLISMYIAADELTIAINFLDQILKDTSITEEHKLYIYRMYLYSLYKLPDNNRFNDMYNNLKDMYKLDNANLKYSSILCDFAFYSYFLKDINTSINYFSKLKSFNLEEYSIYHIDNILEYLTEVNKAYGQLTRLRSSIKLNNDKYKNERFDKYVDFNLINMWEDVLSIWETTFANLDYMLSLVEVENTMDIDKILHELNAEQKQDSDSSQNNITKIESIYSLNLNNFKKLCQNIIQTKLSYSILHEYSDNIINYEYGDDANYLAYPTGKSRKEVTLISFRRWKNTVVGELILRDFLMMVNEAEAKNGILILPVKLTNSAKSYAKHNDKITVYTRSQFETLLKTNFI